MAKMVRLMVAVAADKLADAIDAFGSFGAVSIVSGHDPIASTDTADASEVEPALRRRTQRMAAGGTAPRQRQQTSTPATVGRRSVNPRPGNVVLYTPVGTAKQIAATLASLTPGSMSAAVLSDIAKHPGTTNREVRERLAKWAAKHSLSVESVDNVIWQHVNRGRLAKEAGE